MAASELSPLRRTIGSKLSIFKPTGLSRLKRRTAKYHKLQPKSKTTDELKGVLQTIWKMPQERMNSAVNFTKHLNAYMAVAANGGNSKHLQ